MRLFHALLFWIASACTSVVLAQPYWVRHVGSLGNDHISDVKVDEAGDIYITGEFSGDADIADSLYTAAGGLDCFVAKLSPAGGIIWWKRAGGLGIDRGIKLAFGPNNTLAVVGEFMGVADFQGTTLSSANFTPDMFCMLMDRGTGDQLWIRHGGGNTGSDRPYGVTVAPNGQVTMAGEFQGTASWSGFSLTSIDDQDEDGPTMDVVIVSYAANGDALWVQQGATDRSDRAIDIVNDPQGNLYVAGQFSDTITFDVQHLNAMYNATFLLKLDPSGNEVWFRRCGGGIFDHVRDMLYTPDGNLLLGGDLQGTMIFLDSEPDMISGESPYNYYLLRVGLDGELIAHAQIGSSNGVSARGIDLRNDTIAVGGQFNCQFTGLASVYGNGLFMAAGAEDLFVTKHRYSDLGFISARHYGGPGSKLAGQVASLSNGDVLLCGSFTRSISFATTGPNAIGIDHFPGMGSSAFPAPPADCPDLQNTLFRSQLSRGLKDGLLARTFVRTPVVYDWWKHPATACDHPPHWTMCVGDDPSALECPDTLRACGAINISAFLPFIPSFGVSTSVGPLIEVDWSNGDTLLSTTVEESGTYQASVHTANGCWSWTDDIVAIVDPIPDIPLISDGLAQNVGDQSPTPITLCDPDSVAIWSTNPDPSTDTFWTFDDGSGVIDTIYGTSVYADTTGEWTFHMVSDAGCSSSTSISITDNDTPVLSELDAEVTLDFPQDSLNTDSVWLCPGEELQVELSIQWFLNGVPVGFPTGLTLLVGVDSANMDTHGDPSSWSCPLGGLAPGWNHLDFYLLIITGSCGAGDSLWFHFTEDIWLGLWPALELDLSITGAHSMCVGDSVLITADCPLCQSIVWSGGNVAGAVTNSVWVVDEATYTVNGDATDVHGCAFEDAASHTILFPDGPLLYTDPANGIICPMDSALIYTLTPGTMQIWYGPFGPVPNNALELWSSVPGEYYLSMTDTLGCNLYSDPVLITAYSTPYLNVIPDQVLCLNEPDALLQVMTTAPSTIVWAAPLSGNSQQQVVTEPGVYSVSSTACNITTEMSVTVIQSNVLAQIAEPGPFDLCTGEGVVLHAVPGPAIFIWQPGNIFADSLVVLQPGNYTLQVVDGNGCADTSDVVTVTMTDVAEPLWVVGDSLCAGETAVLTANGSGTVTWYADPGAQNALVTGNSLVLPALTQDTIFYVQQIDGSCTSAIQVATAEVAMSPGDVSIDAPAASCGDESVLITLIAPPGVDAVWSTPTGQVTGTTIVIDPFTTADAGVYTASPFLGDCQGEAISTVVEHSDPSLFSLGPDTTYCIGGYFALSVPSNYLSPVWSTGSTDHTILVGSNGTFTVNAIDANGCAVQDAIQLSGIECGIVIPNVITPNADGDNDFFVVIGTAGYTLAIRVYNRWGQVVWQSAGQDIRWNGNHADGGVLPDGVYYYEILRTGLATNEAYTGYVQILRGK